MNISELQTMLCDLGYAEARNLLKSLAIGCSADERITRMSAPDVIEKGRLPTWSAYSPASVSLAVGVESSITATRLTRLEIDDALHALAVLAGNYDDGVREGRQTYSVDGVMPTLTSAAHEIRRGAL
jgi:hypothetical protein